ncbi:MAG: hypothetical protein KKA79_00755 [Nanoarchaeota archaeon]|nr:hypothetical protein [Nanoarchaeota archaeon]MCG2719002.1 hypothetical protein [Nanoarchaeota archaeon]
MAKNIMIDKSIDKRTIKIITTVSTGIGGYGLMFMASFFWGIILFGVTTTVIVIGCKEIFKKDENDSNNNDSNS